MAGSLFGGPLSTRVASADPQRTAILAAAAEQARKGKDPAADRLPKKGPSTPRAAPAAPRPAPSVQDPIIVKKRKFSSELAEFDDLNDDSVKAAQSQQRQKAPVESVLSAKQQQSLRVASSLAAGPGPSSRTAAAAGLRQPVPAGQRPPSGNIPSSSRPAGPLKPPATSNQGRQGASLVCPRAVASSNGKVEQVRIIGSRLP